MDEKKLYKSLGYREDYDPQNRTIGQDTVEFEGKKYFVSTVGLGLNHRFGEGKPLCWETMILCQDSEENIDWHELYCDRYSSKENAELSHKEILKAFKEGRVKINECGFEFEGFTEHDNN